MTQDGDGAARVVALGGGHGLAQALTALTRLGVAPTAVVTVADDGGSSGRLRAELGIIAPGDLRMALLALARRGPLAAALAHRFRAGSLEGHALGNLLLVALAEQHDGDFVAGLDAAAALLDCAGRVLPATRAPVDLRAVVAGAEVGGQARVGRSGERVERVWLDPPAPAACPEALAAVAAADVVLLGPGSVFTSVAATLLVPELAAAVTGGGARVVLVANLATQAGETGGLDLRGHVAALVDHVPDLTLDVVVAHDGPRPAGSGVPLGAALEHPRVARVVAADLAARRDGEAVAVHDPERLAQTLAPLLAARS